MALVWCMCHTELAQYIVLPHMLGGAILYWATWGEVICIPSLTGQHPQLNKTSLGYQEAVAFLAMTAVSTSVKIDKNQTVSIEKRKIVKV